MRLLGDDVGIVNVGAITSTGGRAGSTSVGIDTMHKYKVLGLHASRVHSSMKI